MLLAQRTGARLQVILGHLHREGLFSAADALAAALDVGDTEAKHIFAEMHRLVREARSARGTARRSATAHCAHGRPVMEAASWQTINPVLAGRTGACAAAAAPAVPAGVQLVQCQDAAHTSQASNPPRRAPHWKVEV